MKMANQSHSSRSTFTLELNRAEQRMQRRWFDLAMAEQRGQSMPVLERMYDTYLRALDEYVALQRRTSVRTSTIRLAS
jgi:hypothetical protein